MKTVAKFPTHTEARSALDVLKARGIAADLLPDEARGGMWQGDLRHLVGYRIDVEVSRATEARECLRQLGFVVVDEETAE